jgi:hypothetical protein
MVHSSGCIQVTNCCCPSSFAKNARQCCQKSFIRPYRVKQRAGLAKRGKIDPRFYSLLMAATKTAACFGGNGAELAALLED